jgi:hypothetical protein
MTRVAAVLVAGSFVVLSGCGARYAAVPAGQPTKMASGPISADKWFAVVVRSSFGACKVDVHPKKRRNPQDERVNLGRGKTAAWVAGNSCSEDHTVVLRDFIHESQPTVKHDASAVFESIENTPSTWVGRVKADARTGRWKYTVVVGDRQEDPEIIIF